MIAEPVVVGRRNVAVIVTGIMLAAALTSFFALRTFARIDRCLDHGGRWTQDGRCDLP
jgi:hypothetical protein